MTGGVKGADRGVPRAGPARSRRQPPHPRRRAPGPHVRQAAGGHARLPRRHGRGALHRLPARRRRSTGSWPPSAPRCWRWPPRRPTAPTPTWSRRSTPRRPGGSSAPAPCSVPSRRCCWRRDPARAREIGRAHTAVYVRLPNYQSNLRRLGFTDDDFADGGSDRLVDAIVAWGDEHTVVDRVRAHFDAGADHVCVQALAGRPTGACRPDQWRALAAGPAGAGCAGRGRPGRTRPGWPGWRAEPQDADRRAGPRPRARRGLRPARRRRCVSGGSSRMTLPQVPQVSTTTPWA